MKIKKLSIVIPVYNEEKTLEKLINLVQKVDISPIKKEIIMVDDGSFDKSVEVMKKIQRKDPKIKVVVKGKNSGKGFTLKEGFKHSTGDYVIVQDADLEYDPQDYKKLLSIIEAEAAQVVYGSRFSGNYEDMTNLHYFGNKLLTIITNLLFGVMLTDMETCYKLLPGNFARNVDIKSARFNFEPEITAKILKSKMRIIEVPISYKGRSFSEGKKITWRDGISALLTLIKFRFVN